MSSHRIGVLTSGGDSPGMNAAIRATVRTALYHGMEVYGIRRGYQGMIEGDIFPMQTTDVANIISTGGTVLKSARSKDFHTPEGRAKAAANLQKHGIDGLVLIGGDGTFRGAVEFFKEHAVPAMGLPGTIDKDLAGTDATIGFDTAVNTAVWAIDKIRETADAHDRLFIVEVMGRDAGYIALSSGIATGAEEVLIPEVEDSVEDILQRIGADERRKKTVHLLVVAEGEENGTSTTALHEAIKKRFPKMDTRVCVLGHIQRGGPATTADRVLASRLGYAAVMALRAGRSGEMVGIVNGELRYTPFGDVGKVSATMDADMLEMVRVLSS